MMRTKMGAMLRTGGAAAASQLLLLATMPIASRLFEPSAFGILGLFVSMSNILSILAHLGYSDAIIAVDEDHEADDLVNAVLWMSLLSLVPVGALAWVAIRLDLLGYGELPLWAVFAVPVQVASIGLVFALQQRTMRAHLFNALAVSHLALGIVRAGGQIVAGVLFATPASLVGSELASRIATVAALLRAPSLRAALGRRMTPEGRAVLTAFRGFAAMRSAGILLNTINVALPTLIVAQHFGLEKVGAITFTIGVLFAPLGFIQKAIGDVFTGTYRTLLRSDAVLARRAFLQVLAALTAIGGLIMVILLTAAEPLFVLLFGSEWALSGQTAQIFAPLLFLMTVVVPLSNSLNILRRPGLVVLFNLLRLGGLVATLVAVPLVGLDYLEAVKVMIVALSTSYLLFGIMVLDVNRKAFANPPLDKAGRP